MTDKHAQIMQTKQNMAREYAEAMSTLELFAMLKQSIHLGMAEMASVESMALVKRLRALGAVGV